MAASGAPLRQSKGMLIVEGDPDCRSAGSFFKNPVVAQEQLQLIAAVCGKELRRDFPQDRGAENLGKVKLPAAWLIEQAGFSKGHCAGQNSVSIAAHVGACESWRGERGGDIGLAGQIAAMLKARFGIRLEMEPVMVGF